MATKPWKISQQEHLGNGLTKTLLFKRRPGRYKTFQYKVRLAAEEKSIAVYQGTNQVLAAHCYEGL